MFDLQHKRITIIGGKRSGMALAELLVKKGARPRLSENGTEDSLPSDFLSWAKKHHVELEFNGHTEKFIQESDVIVLSPGVRIDAWPVQWAKARGIPILGEIEFAFQFCHKPVIAVTGSNGKTTTVTLIEQVLKKAGFNAVLCGNVGIPFSRCVQDLSGVDYVVLEISSFQMESLLPIQSHFRWENNPDGFTFKEFKPFVAVVLNFSQNHLDRHKDMEEYFEAKTKIFQNQSKDDFAVLNKQDAKLNALAQKLNSAVRFFNLESLNNQMSINPNYSAVMIVADILGIGQETVHNVFKDFKGVEHRLELVRCLDGVDYINDSKATTAEATGWALENMKQPTIMICGGRDKNIDYSVLQPLVEKKIKKMIVLGEAKDKLKKVFRDIVEVHEAQDMKEAIFKAQQMAEPGNNILLSPMCASFDMFKDYEHRGQVFKEIVNNLESSELVNEWSRGKDSFTKPLNQ